MSKLTIALCWKILSFQICLRPDKALHKLLLEDSQKLLPRYFKKGLLKLGQYDLAAYHQAVPYFGPQI